MQVDIGQLIELLKNGAAVGIIIFWFIDSIRNWGGTPELKALKTEMVQTHKDLQALIKKLP